MFVTWRVPRSFCHLVQRSRRSSVTFPFRLSNFICPHALIFGNDLLIHVQISLVLCFFFVAVIYTHRHLHNEEQERPPLAVDDHRELVPTFCSFTRMTPQDCRLDQRPSWLPLFHLWVWSFCCTLLESFARKHCKIATLYSYSSCMDRRKEQFAYFVLGGWRRKKAVANADNGITTSKERRSFSVRFC